MIIFPQQVSMDDVDWLKAMALFQVLAIDTRNRTKSSSMNARTSGGYFVSGRDLLVRNARWDGQNYTYPPFYFYSIYFSISAAVIGFIPVNDSAQQDLFQQVLNAALASPYTVAHRNAYVAETCGEFDEKWCHIASADYHYNCLRAEFPNESFEEILVRLLDRGRGKLNATL